MNRRDLLKAALALPIVQPLEAVEVVAPIKYSGWFDVQQMRTADGEDVIIGRELIQYEIEGYALPAFGYAWINIK